MLSDVFTSDFWQVVDHWQTLIAGGLAFVAGLVAYLAGLQQARATKRASKAQIDLIRRKDRAQAMATAAAVYSDILELRQIIQEKRSRLSYVEETYSGKLFGQHVAGIIQTIGSIEPPDMFLRSIDQFSSLGEKAGPLCLEMASLLFQYNAALNQATSLMVSLGADEWAAQGVRRLETHLASLERVATKCEAELGPIRAGTVNLAGSYPL